MKIIKKAFSFLMSACAVLVLSGFLSLRPIGGEPVFAYHEDANACTEITFMPGRTLTEAVPSPAGVSGRLAGVNDSGQLDFNTPGSHLYKACVRSSVESSENPVHPVQGWVWNTNLGWMSFACTGWNNLDGSCGSQDYTTTLSDSGDIRGFAWGDNIGYVSMGCDSSDNNGVACGATNYGVQVALTDGVSAGSCGIVNLGDIYGYGWSDRFGWVNFCGAHIDIDEVLSGGAGGYSAVLSFAPHGSGADGTTVYANGSDSHEARLQILKDGVVIDPGAEGIAIGLGGGVFLSDTVRTDQITGASGSAVTQNIFSMEGYAPPFGYWDTDNMRFVSQITSIAPTGEWNSFNVSEFPLISISEADGDSFSVEATVPAYSFNFAPPVTVARIESPEVASGRFREGEITTISNASQEVHIVVSRRAALPSGTEVNVGTQIYDCLADDEYDFSVDISGTGVDSSDVGTRARDGTRDTLEGTLNSSINTSVCVGALAPPDPVSGVDVQGVDFGSGDEATLTVHVRAEVPPDVTVADFESTGIMGLQTVVSYVIGGQLVQYYSLNEQGGAINQAPDIRGNVRVDIVETAGGAGSITRSLGVNALSKREPFYRAVKKLIGGGQQSAASFSPSSGRVILDASDLRPIQGNVMRSANQGIFFFNKTNLLSPPGSTEPCSVIIRQTGDISFSGYSTIVTEGCNVFFDQNVRWTPGSALGRLAVVTLEDRSEIEANGNVYICNLVTDLESNIVADGSVFSYGNNFTDCGGDDKSGMVNDNGTPNFGETWAARELLKHQLAIVGSVISNNTVGGSQARDASGNPRPILCDGKKAVTHEEVSIARFCDINFLRYAKTRPDPSGVPGEICWAIDPAPNNVKLSKIWTPSGESSDVPPNNSCTGNTNIPNIGSSGGHGVVNIIFRAPAKDQPVFNVVRTK